MNRSCRQLHRVKNGDFQQGNGNISSQGSLEVLSPLSLWWDHGPNWYLNHSLVQETLLNNGQIPGPQILSENKCVVLFIYLVTARDGSQGLIHVSQAFHQCATPTILKCVIFAKFVVIPYATCHWCSYETSKSAHSRTMIPASLEPGPRH